jgi:RNA polymerase sigma-70 factor (ECF subfamily)
VGRSQADCGGEFEPEDGGWLFLGLTDKSGTLNCLSICLGHNVPSTRDNSTAVEALYRRHSAALLLFALALTGDRSRAQDAVHEVFLRLLEGKNLDHATDVKAYLFACVRNTILNDTKVRRRDVPLNHECAWFEPPNRDYAAEVSLRRALAGLSDDQRQVTVLHIWGDLTFAQVADVLGISSNTAASRYRYALTKLREAMCAQEDRCAKS